MRRLQTFAVLFVSFAIVGLLASACDSGTQEPAASATDAIDIEPGTGASSANQQEIDPSRFPTELPDGVTAEIPANFPKSVPIYPGSAPAVGRAAESQDGAPMSALQLLTLDAPDKVYGYYQDQLEGDGWEIEEIEGTQPQTSITASKGDCRAYMLVTPTDDGGSDIFLVTEC